MALRLVSNNSHPIGVSENYAYCMGCARHDLAACPNGSSWLRVDYDQHIGVCSQCRGLLKAWKAGDRSMRVALGLEFVTGSRVKHRVFGLGTVTEVVEVCKPIPEFGPPFVVVRIDFDSGDASGEYGILSGIIEFE